MVGLPAPSRAVLVVIDVQQRLAPAMAEFGPVVANLQRLVRGFGILSRPVLVTEQYPRGLGPTLPSLRRFAPQPAFEKVAFSCFGSDSFASAVPPDADLVLCGIETHVCVLQTALDGLAAGHRVWLAADAVTSRSVANRAHGLATAQAAGAVPAATESLLFGLLGEAGTDAFRAISRLVK